MQICGLLECDSDVFVIKVSPVNNKIIVSIVACLSWIFLLHIKNTLKCVPEYCEKISTTLKAKSKLYCNRKTIFASTSTVVASYLDDRNTRNSWACTWCNAICALCRMRIMCFWSPFKVPASIMCVRGSRSLAKHIDNHVVEEFDTV